MQAVKAFQTETPPVRCFLYSVVCSTKGPVTSALANLIGFDAGFCFLHNSDAFMRFPSNLQKRCVTIARSKYR